MVSNSVSSMGIASTGVRAGSRIAYTPDGTAKKTNQPEVREDAIVVNKNADYGNFKLHCDHGVDEHLFRTMMKPGTFHCLRADREHGKTHLCVNLMHMLTAGFDGCGDWECVTNIFFYRKDEDGKIKVGAPDKVHHIDNLEGLIRVMNDLSGSGKRIAVFLDDLDRYFDEDSRNGLSMYIRKLILNRRKLRLLLFLSCEEGSGDFENDIRKSEPYRSDYMWTKPMSDKSWKESLTEGDGCDSWHYLEASYVEPKYSANHDVFSSVTDWTDRKKKTGWFFDRDGDSSVLRCSEAFDFDSFWRGLENVSSVSVSNYIRNYLAKRAEAKKVESEGDDDCEKDEAEFAVKLKSIGLTDEAIEYLMDVPKTTLRRHAEKYGFEWRVGFIEMPYRFKRVRKGGDDGTEETSS